MSRPTHDFLSFNDLTREELVDLLFHSLRLKEQTRAGVCPQPLAGRTVGLIFHKASLRTRVSFEVGVHQLGGSALFITDREIELGVRESIADAARVLSRYLDLIVIRTYQQSDIAELARWSDAPVINALTDLLHPCQIFCDLLTIREKLGRIEGFKLAYFGDGNNVARSWIEAAHHLDIDLWIATRPETHPGQEFVAKALKGACGRVTVTDDPQAAAQNAEILYTDVWASMGEKDKAAERARLLAPYQLNAALLSRAKPGALVMHCLPAERGREITDDMMENPQSVVFDEAENRLHGQKSLMMRCLGAI